jgi:hypothetical protein
MLGLTVSTLSAQLELRRPHPPVTVSPSVFPIFGWGQALTDAALLKTMRDAGFNIAGFAAVADVKYIRAAGLFCYVTDKRANGYNWKQLPSDEIIRKNLASLAAEVGSDSAVLGFVLSDEPNAAEILGIAHVEKILREIMPNKIGYVNILPSIATQSQHGASSYEAYVRMIPEVLHLPFISYDNYSLVEGHMRDQFYTNLEIIRRISLDTKTPFWNCILANTHFDYMEPSDATLHLQVYSTLAYGGRGLEFFTYLTYPENNFRLGAIDEFGGKTPTWGMVQRINYELNVLAPIMATLHSTGVYHSPDVPEGGQPLSQSRLVKSVEATQRNIITHPATAQFLVGEFEDARSRPYFMVVNKSLTESFAFDVKLSQGAKLNCISPYSGRVDSHSVDWLAPGAGKLCRIE